MGNRFFLSFVSQLTFCHAFCYIWNSLSFGQFINFWWIRLNFNGFAWKKFNFHSTTINCDHEYPSQCKWIGDWIRKTFRGWIINSPVGTSNVYFTVLLNNPANQLFLHIIFAKLASTKVPKKHDEVKYVQKMGFNVK